MFNSIIKTNVIYVAHNHVTSSIFDIFFIKSFKYYNRAFKNFMKYITSNQYNMHILNYIKLMFYHSISILSSKTYN